MDVTRILLLAGPLDVDGPGSRTLDLSRALPLRGRTVEVFSCGGPLVPRFVRAGVSIFLHRGARPSWLSRAVVRPVVDRARDFEPQIVHCQSPPLSSLGARLARACRCVYVVSSSSRAETALPIRRSRRFRGVVAVDEGVREDLVNSAGLPKQYITVIPDGVDVDDHPAPAAGQHIRVMGIIAPLQRDEGHDDFLRAARLLADKGKEVLFVVAGTGPWLGRLRQMAGELEIARRVTFTWRFGDYRSVLTALDVLAVPSLRDGNARLVLEAVACRKPVIATGIGSLPGIIKDGETGMLVHKNSPGEIAEAAGCLLDNPPLVERITTEAARWVQERHSLAQMTEQTLDFYDRAVNRPLS